MNGAPVPYVLIDLDCPTLSIARNSSRCDFVFLSDSGNWVVPLELKRGSLRASEVLSQLRGGARFIEQTVSPTGQTRFLPIAVIGGKVHASERRKLREKNFQVHFRGKSVNIELLRCGDAIAKALIQDLA